MTDHPESTPALEQQLVEGHQIVSTMKAQLEKVLIGQESVIEQTLIALLAGGHVLIEGVPGLGKTLLVRALSQLFSVQFGRIQFTPDLMPSDVAGHSMYDMDARQFKVRKGPVFTNLLLADEINRAPAKTQSALLEVMQEYHVTIDGVSYPVSKPFMVLATQNPIEQEGTYPLPEAELDRFMMKLYIDFPAHKDEILLVEKLHQTSQAGRNYLDSIKPLLNAEQLLDLCRLVDQIVVDSSVIDYAVRIVRATRNWSGLIKGAGPRGSIYLVKTACARALLAGQSFVTPDDIKAMALPVLRHRVIVSAEREIEGVSVDQLLSDILNEVDAPRR